MRAALLATLLLAACAQTQEPGGGRPSTDPAYAQQVRGDNARLDAELSAPGTFAAGIGETVDLGNGLTVRPLEVVEDTRCPYNMQCVWAGRLRLRVNVSGVETHLNLGQAENTAHGPLLLAIAKPGPWRNWPAAEPRPDYRFGFRRAN